MIRVVLVDDDAIILQGLRGILEAAEDIQVVAEGRDGVAGVELARSMRPDVVLTDIRMPRMDGLAVTAEISALPDPPKVIVLTTFGEEDYVRTALRNGAVGFLIKGAGPEELIQAVRVVAEGNAMLSPQVTMGLLEDLRGTRPDGVTAKERARLETLTAREREVLGAAARGLPNLEIAQILHMSESTVKTHFSRVLTKLEVTNRVQATILARDAGIVG
ncbi:response regulator [Streptomyces olivoreticuli]|uniref:response regulator n=1 Tax=Streptomyces olivoreticuli TaxID=68246 RepID=UPI000E2633F1|nr:response regulator transcription factor [Streptomyces olivoreticuli]